MLNPTDLIYIEHLRNKEQALDRLFDWVDNRCIAGEFDKIDKFLADIDVELQSTLMLIGILCITRPAKHLLKNRDMLSAAAKEKIRTTEGEKRLKGLMNGLE